MPFRLFEVSDKPGQDKNVCPNCDLGRLHLICVKDASKHSKGIEWALVCDKCGITAEF